MARITPEELASLYRSYAPTLRLYARQWPNVDEDLVQEAFIKLAQQPSLPDKVLPWLYQVIRNAALSVTRSDARRKQRHDRASGREVWFDTKDDRIDGREATLQLAELLLEQREVIVARIWGGLTFEEIATLVGCSLPTAHRRYQAGLALLRERLEGTCTPAPQTKK